MHSLFSSYDDKDFAKKSFTFSSQSNLSYNNNKNILFSYLFINFCLIFLYFLFKSFPLRLSVNWFFHTLVRLNFPLEKKK